MTKKLKLMTVTGEEFEISVEETSNIRDLKTKIFESKGQGFKPQDQILVFKGQVLRNEKLISECSLLDDDSNRIIVLGMNASSNLRKKTEELTPLKRRCLSENDPVLKIEYPVSVTKYPLIKGSDNITDRIALLSEMGVSQKKINHVLSMSNYDPERALDYAIELEEMPNKRYNIRLSDQKTSDSSTSNSKMEAKTDTKPDSFNTLIQHPIFDRLCKDLVANPTLIFPMLEELREKHHEVLDYIVANPTEFGEIVKKNANKVFMGPSNPNPTNTKIGKKKISRFIERLNEDEKKLLENMYYWGFPREQINEAFYLCDKDATLTMEYILLNTEFFEEQH